MNAAPRLVAAISDYGMAALAGCAAYTVGPLLGGVLGGSAFAVTSGRGHGIYRGLARLGRVLSPWYGEHWEPVPDAESERQSGMAVGVVVPTSRPSRRAELAVTEVQPQTQLRPRQSIKFGGLNLRTYSTGSESTVHGSED